MCIHARYIYRHCDREHALGHGPRGGRAFRIRPCELHTRAENDLKDTGKGSYGIYDHALPCEGEEYRYYGVDQICHRCKPRDARAAEYPMNQNTPAVAAVLNWHIPYSQLKYSEMYREISYTDPKTDPDDEQPVSPKGFREVSYDNFKRKRSPSSGENSPPVSPKGGPSVSPGESSGVDGSPLQNSAAGREADRETLSKASDYSASSHSELRPQGLRIRPKDAVPVPFDMHTGGTLFGSN